MAKLIPVDPKQCQTLKPNGNTFMTFGGVPGLVRCESVATHVLTEKEPDPTDGLIGSMSVCASCLLKAQNQMGGSFTVQTIEDWQAQQAPK